MNNDNLPMHIHKRFKRYNCLANLEIFSILKYFQDCLEISFMKGEDVSKVIMKKIQTYDK